MLTTGPAGADFCEAVDVLIALADAHSQGKVYDLARLAAHARVPRDRCDLFLNSFALCGWAGRLAAGRWALICDPSRITLADVYRRFVTDPESLSKFAVDPVLIDVLGTSWENH